MGRTKREEGESARRVASRLSRVCHTLRATVGCSRFELSAPAILA